MTGNTAMISKPLFLGALGCALSLALAGCGHVSKAMTSEETLLQKASAAIGLKTSKLSIVAGSVSASMGSVEYTVKTKGNQTYVCSYSTTVSGQSDADCLQVNSSGQPFAIQKHLKKKKSDS